VVDRHKNEPVIEKISRFAAAAAIRVEIGLAVDPSRRTRQLMPEIVAVIAADDMTRPHSA
jgi:hypothetical protein